MSKQKKIIVVGAGIIGICAALQLQRRGCEVILLDRSGFALETSSGNAGGIAFSEIIPQAKPGMLWQVPGWLFDPLGPLAIRWRYLPQLLPWLWKFYRSSSKKAFQKSLATLAALQQTAWQDWQDLLRNSPSRSRVSHRGALVIYSSQSAFAKEKVQWEIRREHGIHTEYLGVEALRQREPSIAPGRQVGVYTSDWAQVNDPYLFSHHLGEEFVARGGRFDQIPVTRLLEGDSPAVLLSGGDRMSADAVIVCAGVWSKKLLADIGVLLPLESERGYHLTLPDNDEGPENFILDAQGGYVILPMEKGLRIAGTVELASMDAPQNDKRAWALYDKAVRYFPNINKDNPGVWMGHRPAFPDSVPVISEVAEKSNIFVACGHGHLGLTLAATTGKLLTSLVFNENLSFNFNLLSVNRFT